MTAWIYLFSKFTPEVLLFEALLIFILTATYSVVWIARRKKVRAADAAIPASVVKAYLSTLIGDAEQLRGQLFGLLHKSEINFKSSASPLITATPLTGGEGELQAKIVDQEKMIEQLLLDKGKIQKELLMAKSVANKGAGTTSPSTGDPDLDKKIHALEAKLAEYSVIEDDLANLKRLQQENAKLKKLLNEKGVEISAEPTVPPQEPPTVTPTTATAPMTPEPASTAPPSPAPEAFEKLVDKVEESLKKEPSTSPESPDKMAKSDEDLLSEFEKMLNS